VIHQTKIRIWYTLGTQDVRKRPMAANARLDQMTQSAGTFTGYQRQPLTPDWPSQGGSAGSNPVGATRKPPLTRPGTTISQPASPPIDRQGRARDARTPAGGASARSRSTSLAETRARVQAELCCREVGPQLEPQGDLERRASTIRRQRAYPICRRPPNTFDPP
jgi:hypothetical protein